MPNRERAFGFISEFADQYPNSWLLMQVRAYDPKTKAPCYGELLAHNRSSEKIVIALQKTLEERGVTSGLPYYPTYSFWHRTNVTEFEAEMMADKWTRSISKLR